MADADEAATEPTVRWGMGDVVIGIVASLVLSIAGVGIALGISGDETTEDIPLWATALLNVPLWMGLLGAVLLATHRKGSGSLREDFAFRMRPVDVPLGLVAGFLGQLAIILVTLPVYKLLGVDTDEVGRTAEDLADRAVHAPDVLALVVMVVLIAPVVEELFHRGLVLRSMERRWGTGAAVVVSSLLFAALHFQWYDLLPLGLAGLLFAGLRVRAGRLGPAIWAHLAFNLTAVISLLASS
jgi:membrane protease YdiL (CAAX protease family)